jgi:hypothetical protein
MSQSPRRTLFFCFGQAKSGTTLLQFALNSHPEVSCPSEHNFTTLSALMAQAFETYNKHLELMDRRTGGQGATLINTDTAAPAFRATVESIVRQAAGHKPIMGANDNSMLGNLRIYDRLFEHPRMIAIFRNPLDQGLSAWHHNQRLAAEEHDPIHRELLQKHGDLAGWLRHRAREFKAEVDDWRAFTAGREHAYTLRFEELVTNRLQSLREVFAFLGASVEAAVIEPIVAATSFETMRASARYPGFFRRAGLDLGGEEVSAELRRELLDECTDAMSWLGYRLRNDPLPALRPSAD